jgi:hypothetical protein
VIAYEEQIIIHVKDFGHLIVVEKSEGKEMIFFYLQFGKRVLEVVLH